MTFDLDNLTDISIKHTGSKIQLSIENIDKNNISIMSELIDDYGFELILDALCETRLKDLKRELDKRIKEEE